MRRVYLDYNATTPLREEARAAMLEAMDVVGNPSSVHSEGRAAKAIVERARGQVGALMGCEPHQVVFTGSATEAVALACSDHEVVSPDVEHDAVHAHQSVSLPVDPGGEVCAFDQIGGSLLAIQGANSETGVTQNNIRWSEVARDCDVPFLVDAVQLAGKVSTSVDILGADYLVLSAHKFGGPKGVAALCLKSGRDVSATIPGGGQEMGRRSGTENIVGIAGFGAAAEVACGEAESGVWWAREKLRNILENALADISKETIFVGKDVPRLPNTSCFITPGWKGETQVMQMDLAGFAISAGSACSSGKVKASRVLKAMGYSEMEAASAVRVSLGLETTEDEIMRFVDAWKRAYEKRRERAA